MRFFAMDANEVRQKRDAAQVLTQSHIATMDSAVSIAQTTR